MLKPKRATKKTENVILPHVNIDEKAHLRVCDIVSS